MAMVNNSYGAAPVYGAQQTYGAQPVTYNPGMPSAYQGDQYRPGQPQQSTGLFGGQQRQLVTRESVVMAAAGVGVALLIGTGPIGWLIGGLIGLFLSVAMNYMKSKEQEKQQIPAQAVNLSPNTSANDAYYQRIQQQQMQQQQQYQAQQTQQAH
jgi:hypothetical protein